MKHGLAVITVNGRETVHEFVNGVEVQNAALQAKNKKRVSLSDSKS